MAVLLWLGVGRVPLGLALMVLLLSWGFIGFITNNLARPMMPADWMVGLVSVPAALLGSGWITRTIARLIARYMPLMETSAKRHDALLGHVGEAIYAIDRNFGMVSVRDKTAGTMQVPCRLGADHESVAKGEAVLVVGYDAKDGMYTVIPYELTGELTGDLRRKLSEGSGDARTNALAAGNGNGKLRQL